MTYESANHYAYAVTGGRFCLEAYMARSDSFANCYDQSSAVQVFGHAIGCDVKFVYLQTFGFIRLTSLMGVDCNNPGYRLTETPAILLARGSRRTPFVDHACCVFEGVVFDACIGPALGTDSMSDYFRTAIDELGPEAYVRPLIDRDKRMDHDLQNATLRDCQDGQVVILDRGLVGQVPRRKLQSILIAAGKEDVLLDSVSTFRALTETGRRDTDGPAIEANLEAMFAQRQRLQRNLTPEQFADELDDVTLLLAALEHLNRRYGQQIDADMMSASERSENVKRSKRIFAAPTKRVINRSRIEKTMLARWAQLESLMRWKRKTVAESTPTTRRP